MSVYFGRALTPSHAAVAKIRALDGIAPATEALTVSFLPHVTASLTVVAGEALRIVLAGPRTTAAYKRFVPTSFFVHVMLAPQAARAVFGVPLDALVDQTIDVEEVWGSRGRALRDELAPLEGNAAATVNALERMLPLIAPAPIVQHAVRALERGTRVSELAARLGIGERGLRRTFTEHLGVSPKRYARIARMQRAVRDVGRLGWAELAAAHGFYDQAHLNAEFRALLRMSPGDFLRRQR